MTAKKKGRCWKGCRPVPGKKPFSKGSCSCGMSALNPGMIELMRGDFAIPALKRALKRGVGNAGKPVSIHQIGVGGALVPALRKNPKNVQRALNKYWGDPFPDPPSVNEALQYMKHSRDWAARAIKEDRAWQVLGGERSGRLRKLSSLTPGMIEFASGDRALRLIQSVMTPQKLAQLNRLPKDTPAFTSQWLKTLQKKKGGDERDAVAIAAKMLRGLKKQGTDVKILAAITPGMIEFVDPRPRDNQGQYVANETGGVDPNSMQAAYGNVEAEKQQRRSMISQRLKQMIGMASKKEMNALTPKIELGVGRAALAGGAVLGGAGLIKGLAGGAVLGGALGAIKGAFKKDQSIWQGMKQGAGTGAGLGAAAGGIAGAGLGAGLGASLFKRGMINPKFAGARPWPGTKSAAFGA